MMNKTQKILITTYHLVAKIQKLVGLQLLDLIVNLRDVLIQIWVTKIQTIVVVYPVFVKIKMNLNTIIVKLPDKEFHQNAMILVWMDMTWAILLVFHRFALMIKIQITTLIILVVYLKLVKILLIPNTFNVTMRNINL